MFSLAEFTSRDGIAEADRALYNKLTASLEASLTPGGGLEVFFAAEVLRATWRAQRWAEIDDANLDEAARSSIAHARASAAKNIRWALTEIRKLQTDREIKGKLGIALHGIADVRQFLKYAGGAAQRPAAPSPGEPAAPPRNKPADANAVANLERLIAAKTSDIEKAELTGFGTEFAKITERTQFVPRNAPCPCGSGQKHKRCCGEDAPPVPGDWLHSLANAA